MLDTPMPVPAGLITALLALTGEKSLTIQTRLGISPAGMRDLSEGRGLFSPFKLRHVAEITGIPEDRIRSAGADIAQLSRMLALKPDTQKEHPMLGSVRILAVEGDDITVQTEGGKTLTGIHPVAFATQDMLEKIGLIPDRDDEDGLQDGILSAPEAARAEAPETTSTKAPAAGDAGRTETGNTSEAAPSVVPDKGRKDRVSEGGAEGSAPAPSKELQPGPDSGAAPDPTKDVRAGAPSETVQGGQDRAHVERTNGLKPAATDPGVSPLEAGEIIVSPAEARSEDKNPGNRMEDAAADEEAHPAAAQLPATARDDPASQDAAATLDREHDSAEAQEDSFSTGQDMQGGQAPDPAEQGPETQSRDVSDTPGDEPLPDIPRDLVARIAGHSSRSRAALSRAIGKDTSFLSGVIVRGRRMPSELLLPLIREAGISRQNLEMELAAFDLAGVIPLGGVPEEPAMAPEPDAGTPPAPPPVRPASRKSGKTGPVAQTPARPTTPPEPARETEVAPVIEVVMDNGCRILIPQHFDMSAAARLIRKMGAQDAP